jgi:hypothetical protein
MSSLFLLALSKFGSGASVGIVWVARPLIIPVHLPNLENCHHIWILQQVYLIACESLNKESLAHATIQQNRWRRLSSSWLIPLPI